MPGQIRTNKRAAKIAYRLLRIPKELQQRPDKKPSKRRLEEWFKNSSASQ
jgi:hypothetical protein